MSFAEFVIAGLLFVLAGDYELVRHEQQQVAGLIPGTTVSEETAHWSNGETNLFAFYWEPTAPRDGGPMVAEESWTVRALEQEVSVTETSMFFGTDQRVLVSHIRLENPEALLLLYSPEMTRPEFEGVLQRLKFRR